MADYIHKQEPECMNGKQRIITALGSALGIGIGGFVAHHFGWRHAFGLVAFPGLIIAIIFYFVKDYKTIQLTFTGLTILPVFALLAGILFFIGSFYYKKNLYT